jgi:DNase/tRNase domain of colicin-like bacteriocin
MTVSGGSPSPTPSPSLWPSVPPPDPLPAPGDDGGGLGFAGGTGMALEDEDSDSVLTAALTGAEALLAGFADVRGALQSLSYGEPAFTDASGPQGPLSAYAGQDVNAYTNADTGVANASPYTISNAIAPSTDGLAGAVSATTPSVPAGLFAAAVAGLNPDDDAVRASTTDTSGMLASNDPVPGGGPQAGNGPQQANTLSDATQSEITIDLDTSPPLAPNRFSTGWFEATPIDDDPPATPAAPQLLDGPSLLPSASPAVDDLNSMTWEDFAAKYNLSPPTSGASPTPDQAIPTSNLPALPQEPTAQPDKGFACGVMEGIGQQGPGLLGGIALGAAVGVLFGPWAVAGLGAFAIYNALSGFGDDAAKAVMEPNNEKAGEDAVGLAISAMTIVSAAAEAAPKPKGFSVAFETELPRLPDSRVGLPRSVSDARASHRATADAALAQAMKNSPEIRDALNKLWRQNPRNNWVWHHDPYRQGVMQLVPRYQHSWGTFEYDSMHYYGFGGYFIWGKYY